MTPISWIRPTLRGLVAVVAAVVAAVVVAVVADGPLDDIDHFLVAWRKDDKATEGERERGQPAQDTVGPPVVLIRILIPSRSAVTGRWANWASRAQDGSVAST